MLSEAKPLQLPAAEQRIQGVIITSDQRHIRVKPCLRTVRKMSQEIEPCVKDNNLSPDLARRVAGKCNFLTRSLCGRVGRAPLKSLYARANSTQDHLDLDKATAAALHAVSDIINHCWPMTVPRTIVQEAFSLHLHRRIRRCQRQSQTTRTRSASGGLARPRSRQGRKWLGAVVLIKGDKQKAACSRAGYPTESSNSPAATLPLSILAPIILEPWLGPLYVQCCDCDNEAARQVLLKGVGKHQPLNCLISARWTWRSRRGIRHRIESVPTNTNMSHPISKSYRLKIFVVCFFPLLGG